MRNPARAKQPLPVRAGTKERPGGFLRRARGATAARPQRARSAREVRAQHAQKPGTARPKRGRSGCVAPARCPGSAARRRARSALTVPARRARSGRACGALAAPPESLFVVNGSLFMHIR